MTQVMSKVLLLGALALSLTWSPAWAQEAGTLTVLTHGSFNVSAEVIAEFTEETGIAVSFVEGGDAGETLNRAILTRDNPLADLLFGVDNNLIARALEADLFEPYQSPMLRVVPERYRFDDTHSATPVTVGFVNFNVDRAWFEEDGQEIPSDIAELTEEAYRGLTVVTNPATSSPGLAFMLATIDRFGEAGEAAGEDDWLEFWADLRDNDLLVTSGWTEAYYTAFSSYGGDRPVVLSYATSPAAEIFFADEALDEAPTGNLFCEGCVYRQIEGVGILRGTQNREAAERFIDFMLSRAFQEDIPLTMFVYPVSEEATLPEVFERFGQLPAEEEIATVASAEIETNLETWLDLWTAVVVQGRDPAELR
ncbi:MAG: thiamine ABC transporter substrate-binding protein [Deinococcota bacterium]|nr:thiamine ABC transporter substrate-binding protein [Deinococcota bacterium]